MNVVFLTPGTGDWYCGACLRDHILAKSLREAGHEVTILPMYLPLFLDEDSTAGDRGSRVVFGGINLYLQGKFRFYRCLPGLFQSIFDHPVLLRIAARLGRMTSSQELGRLTLAMLRFEEEGMIGEMEKLCEWLRVERPDVICMSTALQAGMIRMLKQGTDALVLCGFQGEDGFLDGLPEPWRGACWAEMAERVGDADGLTAPSGFYADLMKSRLGDKVGDIQVLPNGIETRDFQPVLGKSDAPVIGYLARMSESKGLEVMVDAYIYLRKELGHPGVRLHLAGAVTAEDEPLIRILKQRVFKAGLESEVRWSPNLSRQGKIEMLGSLSLFSVPAIYSEAFGLYLIEAMASGVPVVQPDASSFPEILGDSGSGVRTAPGDAVELAQAWKSLLDRPEGMLEMGQRARVTAVERFDVSVMRRSFLDLVERGDEGNGGKGGKGLTNREQASF